MNDVLIHVEDFSVAYQGKPVLWDLDVDFLQGSRTAIVGPNGAGKSTLLKGMLGLLKPMSGFATFWGQPYRAVRRRIAYVPQKESVRWDFPTHVLDVVLMGRYVHLGLARRPGRHDRELAWQALRLMEMEAFADRQISALSGGQQQRVFLARAMCQDPELYLLDEPLAGVDQKTEHLMMERLRMLQQQGKTIVAVHHDLETLPRYFDRCVLMNQTVVASGPVAEVMTQSTVARAYARGVSDD